MAAKSTALTTKAETGTPYQLDPSQTLRAATALLNKIKADQVERREKAPKADLLADDSSDVEDADATPVWLTVTTKKHIVDQKRLKPGRIQLPHSLHSAASPSLKICLITADPQAAYKDLIAHPSFPTDLSAKIARVIGLEKLKAKYKSYESRRQLLAEYDIFLADDRVITYLPGVLGKIFYAGGAKRPVPVVLQGRKNDSENGAKRLKLSEGGKKATRQEPKPQSIAKEIERAIGSALVHLAPSTNTSVKVGTTAMTPQMVTENVDAVVAGLIKTYITKGWKNVRGIHVKGPTTAALPIWLAEELWEDEGDVLDQEPDVKAVKGSEKKQKKRKRALTDGVADEGNAETAAIEGPTSMKAAGKSSKKRKSEEGSVDVAERAARKEAVKRQKAEARKAVLGGGKSVPVA